MRIRPEIKIKIVNNNTLNCSLLQARQYTDLLAAFVASNKAAINIHCIKAPKYAQIIQFPNTRQHLKQYSTKHSHFQIMSKLFTTSIRLYYSLFQNNAQCNFKTIPNKYSLEYWPLQNIPKLIFDSNYVWIEEHCLLSCNNVLLLKFLPDYMASHTSSVLRSHNCENPKPRTCINYLFCHKSLIM
jgi:hypothetical protein